MEDLFSGDFCEELIKNIEKGTSHIRLLLTDTKIYNKYNDYPSQFL